MRWRAGKEAGTGASEGFGGRTARRAVLAAGLLAALAVPAPALAAPGKVASKLRAARAPAKELKQTQVAPLPGGATVYRFQQEVSGVQVLNGEAVVSDGPAAPPELVADSTKPGVRVPPLPTVAKRRAIEIAARSAGVKRLRGNRSARPAIKPGGGGTLVWRVVIPSARPLADFEVLVDAASGDVLRTRNLLQDFRTGHAKLYNPNPVVQHGGFKGLRRDRNDRDTSLLTALRRKVPLPNIRERQHCLRGRWAHAKLGRDPHEVCKRSLNWRGVKRSANRFEALMTYFHLNRAQRYIHRLGFSDAGGKGINDRSQVAIANAFGQDNSFYSPATRRVEFGSGGVDDAEDADVILHEYGHSIQDDQVPGFGSGFQAGSIGEGFGDYLAAVMSSRSPGTANEDDVCIFDWDATSYGIEFPPVAPYSVGRFCGRRADDDRTIQQAQTGGCGLDIHCVGQVWSSALWDLRTRIGIGGRTFDTIVLASQFEYVRAEKLKDAAAALLDADANVNGGAYHSAICDEMEGERGFSVSGCP